MLAVVDMKCDHCGVDNVVFPELHGPGRCDPDLSDLETTVAEPMTIEEIVKAFENVRGADAIFALFHETEPPVDPIDQQIVRHKLAEILKAHKVSVKMVDAWVVQKAQQRADAGILFPEYEPWPEPVDGAELIADLEAYFARFAHAPAESILAASLWTLWTHTFDLFDIAPLLVLTSPTKRCGKTTMLKLIGSVAARRLFSSNLTGAVLFRMIEKYKPTLLIDEADNFARFNDDLKGLLNAGHERMTAQATRTVGDDHDVRTFSTWAPKAFTAIGSLPDTIEDRSIRMVMLRKPADVRKDRARRKAIQAAADPLIRRAMRWAADNEIALRSMIEPELEALHDRAADNWSPLIMIADLCGVRDRAEAAAVALVSGEEAGIDELLLAHIREAFGNEEWIATETLLHLLVDRDDAPWAKWWADDLRSEGGLKKASAALARRIRKFDPDLKASQKRTAADRARGYDRAQFIDLWNRYLPAEDEGPVVSLPGDANLEPLEPLESEVPEILPLTRENVGAHKGHKVVKVSAPRETHTAVASESNGFSPGDIVRLDRYRNRRFKVKVTEGAVITCWELDHGQAGKERSFMSDEAILVERKGE
jgi:Protein of unknown function (DUF3631)